MNSWREGLRKGQGKDRIVTLDRGNVYDIKCMELYQLSTVGCWDQITMPHSEGFVCSHYI